MISQNLLDTGYNMSFSWLATRRLDLGTPSEPIDRLNCVDQSCLKKGWAASRHLGNLAPPVLRCLVGGQCFCGVTGSPAPTLDPNVKTIACFKDNCPHNRHDPIPFKLQPVQRQHFLKNQK